MIIGLIGHGKMGKAVEQAAIQRGHTIGARFTSKNPFCQNLASECDLFIDFSTPKAVLPNLEAVLQTKKSIVIGTTGWDHSMEQVKKNVQQAKTALLYSPNFSLGMQAFMLLAKEAAKKLIHYDLAGFEAHHNEKKDTPSGTAKALESVLGRKIPFSSMRIGTLPGTHSLIFDSPNDTITLTHQAKDRKAFAEGACVASEWLQGKTGVFTLEDLFNV